MFGVGGTLFKTTRYLANDNKVRIFWSYPYFSVIQAISGSLRVMDSITGSI